MPFRIHRPSSIVAAALAALIASQFVASSAAAQSILDPVSPTAASLKRLYQIVFVLGVAVFLLVEGLILYTAVRIRRRDGDGEHKQVHGSVRAEVAWTIAPAVVVLGLAAASYGPLLEQRGAPGDALVVDVTCRQWLWEFAYPEAGMITANELVVPVGRAVRLRLAGADVIHCSCAPQLGGKMDAIPGERQGGCRRNEMWFRAEREGEYWGQCAELCGAQHAGMRFVVRVVPELEFTAWLTAQAAPAAEPAPGS